MKNENCYLTKSQSSTFVHLFLQILMTGKVSFQLELISSNQFYNETYFHNIRGIPNEVYDKL